MGALLFVDAIVRNYRSVEDAGSTFKRLRQECLRLALADWSRVPILFELPVPAALSIIVVAVVRGGIRSLREQWEGNVAFFFLRVSHVCHGLQVLSGGSVIPTRSN